MREQCLNVGQFKRERKTFARLYFNMQLALARRSHCSILWSVLRFVASISGHNGNVQKTLLMYYSLFRVLSVWQTAIDEESNELGCVSGEDLEIGIIFN